MKANYKVVVSPADGTLIKQDWIAISKKALWSSIPFIVALIPEILNILPEYVKPEHLLVLTYLLGRLKDYLIYANKETRYKV